MKALKLNSEEAGELEGYYGSIPNKLEPIPFEYFFILPLSVLDCCDFEEIKDKLKKLKVVDIEFE